MEGQVIWAIKKCGTLSNCSENQTADFKLLNFQTFPLCKREKMSYYPAGDENRVNTSSSYKPSFLNLLLISEFMNVIVFDVESEHLCVHSSPHF